MRVLTDIRGFVVAIICLSGLTLASAQGVGKKEILIGSCTSLTGPAKEQGLLEIEPAQAYFKYINDNGGIRGRKLKLLSLDDGYDPNRAIDCFNELLKQDVFATGFFYGTATSVKYIAMAESNGIPAVGFATGADFLYMPVKHTIFSLRASFVEETTAEVEHLWKDLGLRKIAVIYQNDAFGAQGLKGIRGALARYGSDVVAEGSYERNMENVSEAVNKIRSAKPDAVFLICVIEPTVKILKQAQAVGWKPYFVLMPGISNERIGEQAGTASEGAIMAFGFPSPEQTSLRAIALMRKVLRRYAPEIAPSYKSLQGVIHAMVLVEGLKRAGPNPTREGLIKALESMDGVDIGLGPAFKIRYSPTRHQAFNEVRFAVVRRGKLVPVQDWKDLKKH